MIYFWGLLKAEFVKSIKLTFRYKFNTLFNILFWAVLMVLLSHVLLRGKPEVKTWAFICSFMIWLIANNSFISVVDSIVSETVQGTIEQLYLNLRSFFTLLLVKGLVSSVITIIQSVLTLFICVLLVPSVQAFFFIQWLSVLPLFLISIFSLIGLGIMCASLALKYKSISSFYSMVSSIVFGILTYGAVFISSKTALTLLFPFAEANAAIQQLLLRGSSLTPNTLTVILCNDGLYLLLGYLCLKFLIIKSKESGSLSKF